MNVSGMTFCVEWDAKTLSESVSNDGKRKQHCDVGAGQLLAVWPPDGITKFSRRVRLMDGRTRAGRHEATR